MGETTRLAFRAMTGDDADAVAALDLKCFGTRDSWSRAEFFYAAQDFDTEYIVAERSGKIIACAGAMIESDTAEIQTVAVDPECSGKGIGKMLLIQLILKLKTRGAKFIYLEVRPSNAAAIELYRGFGFEVVDRVENFYGDEDALIMARDFD